MNFNRHFDQLNKILDRRDWLIKITKLERECGIDPWYAEFSEWLVSLHKPNYKPFTYSDLGLIVRKRCDEAIKELEEINNGF